MLEGTREPPLLERSLESGRLHSAYLLSGPGEAPRRAALHFVRGIVCRAASGRPCEACDACRRSQPGEEIEIDGTGKRGPLYRHVGDHADLLWTERGPDDTRVRIGQIRALQHALRLRSGEGGRRAAVIADAEWLNQESQNALLRLLEEPPPETSVVLVTASSAGLLATVRSRCQRVVFRAGSGESLADPERAETLARLESLAAASLPDLLDWAEQFRGQRAVAAAGVEALLASGSAFLCQRIRERAHVPGPGLDALLAAHRDLASCRKVLVQRNANPQMVAERALLALQSGLAA
jgi:DNA polymerase III delta prime subunit